MSGRSSRTKGRSAEREVELRFQDAGFTTDRNIGGRKQIAGDINVAGLAVEVRRREKLSLDAWSMAHEDETPDHLTPVVVYRRSRAPWRCSLLLEDLIDLLREARS